ncbi:MAG: hypothetical protein NTZ50_02870 [Chloroflexi bacterium]|nr:hypothetical protein [Chloroflexota bacterium]
MTMRVDLLTLWSWEYDEPFIHMLQRACTARGMDALFVGGPDALNVNELHEMARRLDSGELHARAVLDRVWDWGGEFETHVPAVRRHVPHVVNDYDLVRTAWNRPHVHYQLMQHGLRVPHLVLLPSYDDVQDVPQIDLSILGNRFSVKGAYSGGSGVLAPAHTWDDVLEQRREWRSDQTLVQEWIEPRMLGDRPAWFRLFYACGSVFPCWQDDHTHVQTPLTPHDYQRFGLNMLHGMMQQIAGLCGLNLFSTEIALDELGRWVVVDYINEPCDYRPKSTITNGVPDEIVATITDRIAGWVKKATA